MCSPNRLMSALESVTPTNIRRSNRLYTYEEEKWDIEVQHEAELRHKQLLLQNNDIQKLIHSANLPKKLQETLEMELAREDATRSHMIKVLILLHYIQCTCWLTYTYTYYTYTYTYGMHYKKVNISYTRI